MFPIMRTSLLLLLSSSALGLTIQKRFPASTYQVKESHFVPKSWARIGDAPADHTINLRIGLAQSRFDELEKSLYEGKSAALTYLCLVPVASEIINILSPATMGLPIQFDLACPES
jgi:hypothetical protein